MRIKREVLTLVLFLLSLTGWSQFEDEIRQFKKQDSVSFPASHGILFVGSSSFRMWKDVDSYFPGYRIINRGFGGSTLPDVIKYYKDIILPYQPKQVVIYCGENDFAASDTVSVNTVVARFKKLFELVRAGLPDANISFVSIKPSPSRERFLSKVRQANTQIRAFLMKQRKATYIDVFTPMLGADGKARPELFLDDALHMKPAGYAIWKKAIQPYLLK
ncbi:MAG TPA: GDSL-type esterase/lipase family protein [Flavisolibacter sp.]|jgi:lysophospholipase L1-like esterase|nr:GDSL-type esterase/lipase family protein [Flavisolibacter sp.]